MEVPWILPDKPGTFGINIKLLHNEIDHLLDPCSSISLKVDLDDRLVMIRTQRGTITGVKIVPNDPLGHLRTVIVVTSEERVDLSVSVGESEGQEGK